MSGPLNVLVVDDEALARQRLRTLLPECGVPLAGPPGEASGAAEALSALERTGWDVLLLDIHMPGTDGLALAHRVRGLPRPPAVVFVTAHAEHALQAFELEAVDYLTKPVRRERLRLALEKAARWRQAQAMAEAPSAEHLVIHERGRTERVPLDEILYLKAELKYVTVRTTARAYLYDGSLHELEQRHGERWQRVHRNALVARRAMRALERVDDPIEGEGWVLRLAGLEEAVQVSRRQLAQVREAMARGA